MWVFVGLHAFFCTVSHACTVSARSLHGLKTAQTVDFQGFARLHAFFVLPYPLYISKNKIHIFIELCCLCRFSYMYFFFLVPYARIFIKKPCKPCKRCKFNAWWNVRTVQKPCKNRARAFQSVRGSNGGRYRAHITYTDKAARPSASVYVFYGYMVAKFNVILLGVIFQILDKSVA